MIRAAVLMAAFLGAFVPRAATGQEISGVALDQAGQPIPGIPVALHRVGGGGGGATVAATTTGEDGGFEFLIEALDSAVYFVAMRHDERMYIGPPARGGAERVTDYVIRAEPGSEAGAVASALSGSGPVPGAPLAPQAARPGMGGGAGGGAVWFVVILAIVVAATFVTTAPGYRRKRSREMVMELARVENRLAAAGPDADTAADARRRDELRARLAPRT